MKPFFLAQHGVMFPRHGLYLLSVSRSLTFACTCWGHHREGTQPRYVASSPSLEASHSAPLLQLLLNPWESLSLESVSWELPSLFCPSVLHSWCLHLMGKVRSQQSSQGQSHPGDWDIVDRLAFKSSRLAAMGGQGFFSVSSSADSLSLRATPGTQQALNEYLLSA